VSEPRCDIAAERLLLGAVLNGHKPDPIAKLINPADFYQPRHEAIWHAILRVRDAGNPIDVASVRVALDQAGSPIDPLYLAELYGEASLTADGTWHAERVAEEARSRRLVAAGLAIMQAGESRELPAADAAAIAHARLAEATSGNTRTALASIGEILPEVIAQAESGASPALSTPWPDIDRIIGGMAPGRLVVIGARPGGGKSTMGTNLAAHMAGRHGHAALIISPEMPRMEVVQRITASEARVDVGDLINGTLDERQWGNIRDHYDDAAALPILVDDDSMPTVASIRSHAAEAKSRYPDLALIVVDYLQLMSIPDAPKGSSRATALGIVTRGLKVLARETHACVVAMAQLNREGVKNGNKPTMGDLRESGSIENDADQVILLHRPDDDLPEVDALIDKNRWGPKSKVPLYLAGHYARFDSATTGR